MKTHKPLLPPLKTLPTFIAVAQHLSFTKAAKALFITHSAVSQSIRQLESFLGVKLFDRSPQKQVALTAAGREYLHHINNALNTISTATAQLRNPNEFNVLTVNVLTTLAMRWLIPRLPSFQTAYPNIDFRLSTLGRDINFIEDNVDISINYGRSTDWPELHQQKLFDDHLTLIGNASLKKENLTGTLFNHYKAIYVKAPLRQNDWKKWCRATCIKEPPKKDRIYFTNSTQALQAAISGVGIMVTHNAFIEDDLNSGQLALMSDKTVSMNENYYALCPKEKCGENKIKNFLKWLAEQTQTD